MPCFCWVFALIKAVTGFIASYELYRVGDVATFDKHWAWAGNVTLATATVGDVFTAVSLSYVLWRKRDSGFSRYALIFRRIQTVRVSHLLNAATLQLF